MPKYVIACCLILTELILSACAGDATAIPAPTEVSAEPSLTSPPSQAEEPDASPEEPTPLPEPTAEVLPAEPQHIEFASKDGTALVGLYWPPARPPAPGIILMHWAQGDKSDWTDKAALFQGRAIAASAISYAVLNFDFRGYGESGGEKDRTLFVDDALAALAIFRTLPGVDPDNIVLIGASIGADAAVDGCGAGCVGAVSLSPGSYLGIPYADALTALGDKPVLCVAAEGDSPSPETCQDGENVGLNDYMIHIYQGAAHGMDMFMMTDEKPFLTDLLFEWLAAHLAGG